VQGRVYGEPGWASAGPASPDSRPGCGLGVCVCVCAGGLAQVRCGSAVCEDGWAGGRARTGEELLLDGGVDAGPGLLRGVHHDVGEGRVEPCRPGPAQPGSLTAWFTHGPGHGRSGSGGAAGPRRGPCPVPRLVACTVWPVIFAWTLPCGDPRNSTEGGEGKGSPAFSLPQACGLPARLHGCKSEHRR
jgi:hypothetical protein